MPPSTTYPRRRIRLAFGGTNLTNERFVTAGSPNYPAGVVDGNYNEPAEWYITLRVKMQ